MHHYTARAEVVDAEAGGVQLLVGMLSTGTDGGQLHAASTLATMATTRTLQEAIVKAGAIEPLVKLLRTGSNKAQTFAAAAVASISELPEEKDAVIKAGAIAPLVRLLRSDVACDGQVYASDATLHMSGACGHGWHSHFCAPMYISLVILHTKRAGVA